MIDSFLNIWYNQQLGQLLGWIAWIILAAFCLLFSFGAKDKSTFAVKLGAAIVWWVGWAIICWVGSICPPIMGVILLYIGRLTYKQFSK